jgi:hypothetical protein
VNGGTYRQKKGGGPFDLWEGKHAVTQRKHTLILGYCRIVGQSIRGRGTCQ